MSITLFYIPLPNEREARQIATQLLTRRLVACAHWMPIGSAYWWNAAITQEYETLLLLKTRPNLQATVTEAVEALHSYEIPCIAHWQLEVNAAYEAWVIAETSALWVMSYEL